eukprot:6212405-Pleurochrysis_carterae.AAC.7
MMQATVDSKVHREPRAGHQPTRIRLLPMAPADTEFCSPTGRVALSSVRCATLSLAATPLAATERGVVGACVRAEGNEAMNAPAARRVLEA